MTLSFAMYAHGIDLYSANVSVIYIAVSRVPVCSTV